MAATAADIALLTQPFRTVLKQVAASGRLKARKMVVSTALQTEADADAVATRILNFENAAGRARVTLFRPGVEWTYKPGQTVSLQLGPFSLNPATGLIVGVRESGDSSQPGCWITLEVKNG